MDDFLANGSTSADPRGYLFSDILSDSPTTEGVIRVMQVLTTPTDYSIDSLSDHFDTTGFGKESYAKFLTTLQSLSTEIDTRNEGLAAEGKPIYPYLNPSLVPASIDI